MTTVADILKAYRDWRGEASANWFRRDSSGRRALRLFEAGHFLASRHPRAFYDLVFSGQLEEREYFDLFFMFFGDGQPRAGDERVLRVLRAIEARKAELPAVVQHYLEELLSDGGR